MLDPLNRNWASNISLTMEEMESMLSGETNKPQQETILKKELDPVMEKLEKYIEESGKNASEETAALKDLTKTITTMGENLMDLFNKPMSDLSKDLHNEFQMIDANLASVLNNMVSTFDTHMAGNTVVQRIGTPDMGTHQVLASNVLPAQEADVPYAQEPDLCHCICECLKKHLAEMNESLKDEPEKIIKEVKKSKLLDDKSKRRSRYYQESILDNFYKKMRGITGYLEKLGHTIFSNKPVEQFLQNTNVGGTIRGTGALIGKGITDVFSVVGRGINQVVGEKVGGIIGKAGKGIGNALGKTGSAIIDTISVIADVLKDPFIKQMTNRQEVHQLAFETEGINRGGAVGGLDEQAGAINAYNVGAREALLTNQSMEDIQKVQIANWRRGIREAGTLNRVTVTGLNTARMLGASADATATFFADMHQNLQMSGMDLANMGRGLRDIARNTGITGDNLIQVARSSEQFMKNMRNAGTLTSGAGRNIMGVLAEAQTTGTSEGIQKLLDVMSRGLIAEGGDERAKTLATVATGGDNALLQQLINGTITQDRAAMAQFATGLERNVLNLFTRGRRVEDLSAGERRDANLALQNAFGVGLQELVLQIQNFRNAAKSFSERFEEAGQTGTPMQRQERQQSLAFSATLEYLTQFDTALRSATTSGEALSRFNQTAGRDFARDMQTLAVDVEGGRASNTTMSQLLGRAATDLDRRLTAAGVSDETLRMAGVSRVTQADIDAALAAGPAATRTLIDQIRNLDLLATTQQKKNQDPVSRIEADVRKIQGLLTEILNKGLLDFAKYVDKIYQVFDALAGSDWSKLKDIGKEIVEWVKNAFNMIPWRMILKTGLGAIVEFLKELPKMVGEWINEFKGNDLIFQPLIRVWAALIPMVEAFTTTLDGLLDLLSGDEAKKEAGGRKLITGLLELFMYGVINFFGLLPALFIGAAGSLTEELGKILEKEGGFWGKLFGVYVTNIGAWFKYLGDSLQGLLDMIHGLLSGDTDKIAAGAKKFFTSLYGVVIVGLETILTLMIDNILGSMAAFTRILISLFNYIFSGEWLELFKEGGLKKINGYVLGILGTFGDGAGILVNSAKRLWERIVFWFEFGFNELVGHSIIPDLVLGVIEWFAKLPLRIFNILLKLGSYITKAIGFALENLGDNIGGNFGGFIKNIGELFSNTSNFFEGLSKLITNLISTEGFRGFSAGFQQIIEAITQIPIIGLRAFGNIGNLLLGGIQGFGHNLIDMLFDVLSGIGLSGFEADSPFRKTVKDAWDSIMKWVIDKFNEATTWAENKLKELKPTIDKALSDLFDDAMKSLDKWWTDSGENKLIDLVNKVLDAFVFAFKEQMLNLTAYILDQFHSITGIGEGGNVKKLEDARAALAREREAERKVREEAERNRGTGVTGAAGTILDDLLNQQRRIAILDVKALEQLEAGISFDKIFRSLDNQYATLGDTGDWVERLTKRALEKGSIYTHDTEMVSLFSSFMKGQEAMKPVMQKILASGAEEEAQYRELMDSQDQHHEVMSEELEAIEENTSPLPDLLKQAVLALEAIKKALVPNGRRRGSSGSNQDINEEVFYNPPLNTTWEAASYTDTQGVGVDIDRT